MDRAATTSPRQQLLKFKFATNTPIKIRQPTLLYFFSFSFFKKNKNLLLKISSFFPLSFTLSWFLKKTLLLFMGEKPLILSLFFYFFIILIPSLKKILFCKIFFFPLFHIKLVKKKKDSIMKTDLHVQNESHPPYLHNQLQFPYNNFLLNITNSPTVVTNHNKLLLNSSTEFCYQNFNKKIYSMWFFFFQMNSNFFF